MAIVMDSLWEGKRNIARYYKIHLFKESQQRMRGKPCAVDWQCGMIQARGGVRVTV